MCSTCLRSAISAFKLALLTSSSLVRSRTDCAIVFAVTSSMVKNTAATMALRIAPMLPIWLRKDCAIARSVEVLVSAGELANCWSI